MTAYYEHDNANVHRGLHTLANRATAAYEGARGKARGVVAPPHPLTPPQLARFVNAASPEELVFTRGATEALNLVASSWGARLRPGDEVALSVAEHHSNLVPWQLLSQRTGCVLRFAAQGEGGAPPGVAQWRAALSPRTRLIATAHVSNVLASTAPVQALAELAEAHGALLLLDACQSAPHEPLDARALGAHFLVASGHKMLGPTGVGFLWARGELLQSMPPWEGGGEMIDEVGLSASTYAPPPARFEAGTPNIAGAVGLGAAVDYLTALPGGMAAVQAHGQQLGGLLAQELARLPGLRLLGPPAGAERAPLAAFTLQGVHAGDLAQLLDAQCGVAIRAGHHCTQPLHAALGIPSSARASCHIYSSEGEVEELVRGVRDVAAFLREAMG